MRSFGHPRGPQALTSQSTPVSERRDCVCLKVLEPGAIDVSKMLEHDVPVDIIVTPTRVIRTNTNLPKPPGILWWVHRLALRRMGEGVGKQRRGLRAREKEEADEKLILTAARL